MDKQIITFSANEQNLVRIGGEYHYSSNKVSYIGAHFDLGTNWDGFDSVRAVWFTDRINGISTVLDGEGNCTVPTEVLKKKDRVFVNLVGSIVSNGELTDRLTTYPAVALVVDSKAKVDSTETAPVTPSQFEQFVSIVQDAVANIKDIVSTTLNADYTLTFVYSDGTSYTTPSIRGERGPQGADGADGTDGNGIASAVLNSNYTLTLTFTDGTSYTTPSIRGAQGPKGDPGDVSQAQLDAAVTDLKSEISGIGIVGYTQEGKYVDCISSAQKTSGAYCYNGYVGNVVKMLSVNIASYNWYVLPVVEGEVYHIRTVTVSTPRAYYFAKADGAYISRFPSASESEATVYDEIVTIPSGVEALYVNEFLNTSEAFFIEKKVSGFTYKRNADWYSFDSLYGKKLACVGDSMTEATDPNGGYFQNYAQIVAMRHNMEVYKDGVGGSTMANVSGHNAFSDARYLNVPSDYDILTIWFGWNDATYATVGTIDDETDDTFYGAYNKVLEYFIATYPTKKIGLIVPYGNSSVEPFREAVRNISKKFGVPCLDLTDYNQCSCIWGIDNESQEARRSALTYDGTHPNQDGHIYLSTMYEEFIKRI